MGLAVGACRCLHLYNLTSCGPIHQPVQRLISWQNQPSYLDLEPSYRWSNLCLRIFHVLLRCFVQNGSSFAVYGAGCRIFFHINLEGTCKHKVSSRRWCLRHWSRGIRELLFIDESELGPDSEPTSSWPSRFTRARFWSLCLPLFRYFYFPFFLSFLISSSFFPVDLQCMDVTISMKLIENQCNFLCNVDDKVLLGNDPASEA
jgi:hypothetical protein